MRSLKLLVLLAMTFISVHCKLETFYVKPAHNTSNCSCPNDTLRCATFDVYANITRDGWIQASSNDTGREIELIFLCGNHTLNSSNIATLNLSRLSYLAVKGYAGDKTSPVVIQNVILKIQNISKLHMEDVTIVDITFSVHPADLEDKVIFHIKNSIFIQSDCLIVHSDLTIENSDIINGTNTAFNMVSSTLTLTGNVNFRGNSGERGGALGLISSHLNISRNTTVTFSNNHATSKGGAIFVNNPIEIYKVLPFSECFYHLLDYNENASYNLTFTGNLADKGGSHIFGSSLKSFCTAAMNESVAIPSYKVISLGKVFHFENPELLENPNSNHSAIAAPPARICVCDENNFPQCVDESKIFMSNITHLPGETFSLSVVLVGGDFGSTIGVIQANLLSPHHNYPSCSEELPNGDKENLDECYQLVYKMNCTKVKYTIYSKNPNEMLSLMALKSTPVRDPTEGYKSEISDSIKAYINEGVIRGNLMFTPLFIDVTLKHCPPGFSLGDEVLGCDCYLPLKNNYEDLKCLLSNSSGLLSHPKLWIGASSFNETEVIMSSYCPLCNQSAQSEFPVTLESSDSINTQCALNHADRLCGRCKEGYSLAIGSSKCVRCSNNKNLALLVFFAAAGLLLILFITLLNLTVTQGMINGVILYANIIWVYETIVFPQETTGVLLFLRIFIAWLNLDFGIETCFVVGLDAFWKTLLQYLFPMYIWSIVLVIIFGAKYSTRLTKLFGSQTVSILSTMALLSYMKLLRNAIMSLSYAHLDYYNSKEMVRRIVVWAMDGTLKYCEFPHFFLFTAALITLCLCLPYILLLLLGRWLRNLSYFTRFHPIFDSYFASIKNQHHYWPGVLLVVRAFLYLIQFNVSEREATFVLLITVVALLGYMSIARPQRSLAVFTVNSAFLVNLVILSGAVLYIDSTAGNYKGAQSEKIVYITIASTGVAAVKFCIIIVSSLVRVIPYSEFSTTYHSYRLKYQKSVLIKRHRKTIKMPTTVSYTSLRDSILEDSEPPLM